MQRRPSSKGSSQATQNHLLPRHRSKVEEEEVSVFAQVYANFSSNILFIRGDEGGR